MNTNTDLQPELMSLRTKLIAEIENDKGQRDLFDKRIEKNTNLLTALNASLNVSSGVSSEGYGSKRNMIKEAIKSLKIQPFTQDDVEKIIKQNFPTMEIKRDNIRSALWSLAHHNEGIRAVSKGNNVSPAKYEVIGGIVQSKQSESTAIAASVTLEQFESAVRHKIGRIAHLAKRLNTTPQAIADLLSEPECKVEIGDRGYIRPIGQ